LMLFPDRDSPKPAQVFSALRFVFGWFAVDPRRVFFYGLVLFLPDFLDLSPFLKRFFLLECSPPPSSTPLLRFFCLLLFWSPMDVLLFIEDCLPPAARLFRQPWRSIAQPMWNRRASSFPFFFSLPQLFLSLLLITFPWSRLLFLFHGILNFLFWVRDVAYSPLFPMTPEFSFHVQF